MPENQKCKSEIVFQKPLSWFKSLSHKSEMDIIQIYSGIKSEQDSFMNNVLFMKVCGLVLEFFSIEAILIIWYKKEYNLFISNCPLLLVDQLNYKVI